MPTYSSTPIFGRRNFGLKAPTTGTNPYTLLIEPMNANAYTYLEFAQFTTTATAQTVTIARPLSYTTNGAGKPCSGYLTAAAAGNQAVINVNQNPGTYTGYNFNGTNTPRTANLTAVSGHYARYQYPDGTWEVNTISSISTLAFTLGTSLSTGSSNLGLAIGAPVFFFGVCSATPSTSPYDALAHPVLNLYAPSNPTTINIGSEGNPFMGTFNRGEPLLLVVTNGTNAVATERVTAVYTDRGSPYAW